MKLDGKQVVSVREVAWQDNDDERLLEGATIAGRAVVDVEGGGRFHGLVIETRSLGSPSPWVVVVWERSTGRFACVPL